MYNFGSLLKIDEKREADKIEKNIQNLLVENSADGIIIGLSGGIDSAVLAALAVRAIGHERIHSFHLYDRESAKDSRIKAALIADRLGLTLTYHNITPEMQKMKIYAPLIMRITAVSGILNRCLDTKLHRLLNGESSFISTLRRNNINPNRLKRFLYNRTVGRVEAAFNARHKYRRQFLEQQAKEKNCLLLGAANKSELMVGWFVKGGIDDMPLSPIINLYKTQVRQLAKYLDLPSEIQTQAPSPDMAKGITDEDALGISYEILDVILHYISCGTADDEIISNGISHEDLLLVRTMNKLSEWKRKPQESNMTVSN